MKKLSFLLATVFGVGYARKAPGTMGSLVTLPLVWALSVCGGWPLVLVTAFAVYVVGVFSTREVLKYTPHDPSFVVIDEVVGQLLAFVLVSGIYPLNVCWLAGGFAAFRFFDILKPWPVSYFDRKWQNATGVMMDDVMAGLYAAGVLKAVCLFL